MGWDARFIMQFPERADPVLRFRAFAALVTGLGVFGQIHHVVLFNQRKRLLELGSEGDFDYAVTEEQLRSIYCYMGTDLGVQCSWQIFNSYCNGDEAGKFAPVRCPSTARFDFRGSEFPLPYNRPHKYELEYTALSSKWYMPQYVGQVGSINRDAIVREMQIYTDMGPVSIWGKDEDYSANPADSFLCFHRDTDCYRRDLHLMEVLGGMNEQQRWEYEVALDLGAEHAVPDNYLSQFRAKDVLDAIQRCPGISLFETDAGAVIYPDAFTGDRLWEFYDALRACVDAHAEQ